MVRLATLGLRITCAVFMIIAAGVTGGGSGIICGARSRKGTGDGYYIQNWLDEPNGENYVLKGNLQTLRGNYYVFVAELVWILVSIGMAVVATRPLWTHRPAEAAVQFIGSLVIACAACLATYYVGGWMPYSDCYVTSWAAAAFFLWATSVLLGIDAMIQIIEHASLKVILPTTHTTAHSSSHQHQHHEHMKSSHHYATHM